MQQASSGVGKVSLNTIASEREKKARDEAFVQSRDSLVGVMGMRTRNCTQRDENGADPLAIIPSLSTSSSVSPTRTHGSSSPSKLDAAVITSTPLLPFLPHQENTPSPFVRRALTYSPTKRSKPWPRQLTFLLLILILVSVFLTMLSTILLMDPGESDGGGPTFGTPVAIKGKPKINENPTSDNIIGEHPFIRGGHGNKFAVTDTTNLADEQSGAEEIPKVDERINVNNRVVPVVKRGDETNDITDDDASEKSRKMASKDEKPMPIEGNVVNVHDDMVKEHQLDVIGDVALSNSKVNSNDQEDSMEDRPDFPGAQHEKQGEESDTETANKIELIETDKSNDEKLAASKRRDDQKLIVIHDLELQHDVDIATQPGQYPRIAFYELDDPPPIRTHRDLPNDEMLHAPPGFEASEQDRMKPDYTQGDCVPMHDWQTKSFPNCNLIHEYDMNAAGPGTYKNNTNLVLEDSLVLLGQGWFRHTWRLNTGATGESVVLKTLRLEREFYDEFYDLHRRDAVAMERLTHSPFIMDIYGYCGQSALNELAEFGKGLLASLEKVDRRMRGNDDPDSNMLKLQLGASVAVGVAHIHEVDDDDRPSMVHYDLNPRNVAIVSAGKPKINDFNIAEFLRWNPKTNETCGFPSRLHEPWWRAPEEVSLNPDNSTFLTAAVDVYALGSMLYHILTSHSPRGKMKKERAEEVREKVMRGEPPDLDKEYTKSKDPSIVAFRKAMKLCFVADPKKRGTAREVADILLSALLELKKQRKAQRKGH